MCCRRKLRLDEKELEDKRRAIMKKSGKYRVRYTGLNGYRRKYLYDLYITMVDLKWRYALALFFNLYLLAFFVFGVFWWIIAYNHGDFDHVHDPNWELCVSNVNSFARCLLFSIETQTTIGYGVAYPNTNCEGTLFMVYLQITVGILMDNLLLGFIFVKFAQPKRRQKTMIFSKNACITHHNGKMAVQVRVGDVRKSHLLAAQVHGVLVRRHVTEEGVVYPIYLKKMKFTADDMDDTITLMWPMVLTHNITEDSPFWDIKPADLTNEKYELIVYVEGTIETTGEFCQVRTSYTPREFLWGHRFDRIEEFDSGNARWEIDFAAFHDVVYVSNIRHSAKELASFRDRNSIPDEDSVYSKDPYDKDPYDKDPYDNNKTESLPTQRTQIKTLSYNVVPTLPVRGPPDTLGRYSAVADDTGNESDDTVRENKLYKTESTASFMTAADDDDDTYNVW